MRRLTKRSEHWRPSSPLGTRIPLISLIQSLAVAEYLCFRQAAAALGVSQSSVSTRIKALEEELGIVLFERHTRGVRLSEAGRQFIEGVTAGVSQLDQTVILAGTTARGDIGRIRVGVYAWIPGSFLDVLITRFRKRHPDIAVEIAERTARDCIMLLRENQLDIAIIVGVPHLPDCHSCQIWSEQLVAAIPDSHPLARQSAVTWDKLAGDAFLVRRGGAGPQALEHIRFRLNGRWPDPAVRCCDVERYTLLHMIAQGCGVSITGQASAIVDVPGVVFRLFQDEPEPIPFSAVWSPTNCNPSLRSIINLAREMGRTAQPLKNV